MNRLTLFLILFGGMPGPITAFGQASDLRGDPNRDIRFEQHLNQSVNPEIEFIDEQGRIVLLGKYFNQRSVVIAMGYYRCPMLCGVVLNAFVQSLQDLPPTLAMRDFNFIFVSIDPQETNELARNKLED
ncbi:MAG: SCO family protein, partial [Verrucomicrobia bacterium]|nr:SCO family protein [Verrucomicrobiota bacterium]